MFDSFEKSYTTTIELIIHYAGIECYKTIPVGVGAQSHATALLCLGYHYARFYGVQCTATFS